MAQALANVDRIALAVRAAIQKLRDESAAGPVARKSVLNLLGGLNEALTVMQAAASVQGIAAYATEQKGDPSLDIAAEFVAMRNAVIELRDWINANFPTDSETGAALTHVYDQAGAWTALTFTTQEMSGFRTRADALLAVIG